MYGRAGMLAHPYMLGPDGQSNGCVSVQDYSRFLEAFLRGEIDRLIVVPKLANTYAANAPALMTTNMRCNEFADCFTKPPCGG